MRLLRLLLFVFVFFTAESPAPITNCPVVLREMAHPVFPGTNQPLYRFGGKLYKVYTRARFKEHAEPVATAAKHLSQTLEAKLPGDFVKVTGVAEFVTEGKKEPALELEDLHTAGMDDLSYFVRGKTANEVGPIVESFRDLLLRIAREKVVLLDHQNAANFMTNGKQVKVIDLEAITLDPKSAAAQEQLKGYKRKVADPDGVGLSEVLCQYHYDLYRKGHMQIVFESRAWAGGMSPSPLSYDEFRKLVTRP